jgi:hypothetical protein
MNDSYTERIAQLKTPESCETFARNAETKGRSDLALAARRRAVELRAASHSAETQAEKEALRAVYAYEEALAKNGTSSDKVDTSI